MRQSSTVDASGSTIGIVCSHSVVRELLSDALVERGHRLVAVDPVPIENPNFPRIHARLAPCDAIVVCVWGLARRGRHLVRHLCAVDPTRRLVVLDAAITSFDIDSALRAGALSVVGSHATLSETIEVIEAAAAGDSRLLGPSPHHAADPLSTSRPSRRLSPREAEILQLVVDGLDVRTIADRLYISSKTVKHHLSAIYVSLRASNRTEAVVRGVQLGYVEIEVSRPRTDQASATSPSAKPSGAWPPSL
jgi:DNA-binding NarL/FixJ family response regulator